MALRKGRETRGRGIGGRGYVEGTYLLQQGIHVLYMQLNKRSLGPVTDLSRLQSHFNVATLQSQVEAGALILNKMQGHLRETLGLQIRNDGLATQSAALDHLQHMLKLVL